MSCKHYDKTGNGWCTRPEVAPMICDFSGDVQECLDNLMDLNEQGGILWQAYETICLKQSNPMKLSRTQEQIAEDVEKNVEKLKKGEH